MGPRATAAGTKARSAASQTLSSACRPLRADLPGARARCPMRTLDSGVPYFHSYKFQQDDLVMNASMTTGGYSRRRGRRASSVRVYLPAL